MQFEHPHYFHFLWLLPVAAWGLHLAYRRRERKTGEFVQLDLLPQEDQARNRRRWRWKAICLVAAAAAAIVALARPQWGYQMQLVKRQGLDILLAVDVSKSMLTQDVRPSRLERTTWALRDLVKKLKGDRVGLIAFAGSAFLVCPLTVDYSGFLLSLEDLGPESIPRGGTNLSSAIAEAVKSFQSGQPYKAVVLITDGEEQEGNALKAAETAREKGIKIYTVGIGTQQGDLIKIPNPEGGETFLKDEQGNYVKSRLNENLLQKIAYTTGGAYIRSSGTQFGLDYLYEEHLSKLEKRDIEDKMEKKYHERFQWVLILVLIALVVEAGIGSWRRHE